MADSRTGKSTARALGGGLAPVGQRRIATGLGSTTKVQRLARNKDGTPITSLAKRGNINLHVVSDKGVITKINMSQTQFSTSLKNANISGQKATFTLTAITPGAKVKAVNVQRNIKTTSVISRRLRESSIAAKNAGARPRPRASVNERRGLIAKASGFTNRSTMRSFKTKNGEAALKNRLRSLGVRVTDYRLKIGDL